MDRIRSLSSRKPLIGLTLVVAILAVGCSGKSPTTGGTASNTIAQGPNGKFVFAPDTLSVKSGATLTIRNDGTIQHTFTITNQGIDITNDAGQSHQVTINLSAGTYPFICRFHEGFGMKGTLTVTG